MNGSKLFYEYAHGLIGQLQGGGFRRSDSVTGDWDEWAREQAHSRHAMETLCKMAYEEPNQEAMVLAHSILALVHDYSFRAVPPSSTDQGLSAEATLAAAVVERHMLAFEEEALDAELVRHAPHGDSSAYIEWMLEVIHAHPAWNHPLYHTFLRSEANRDDLIYYFIQESTFDPRFDDILAFLQLGAPDKVKIVIAKNYWDEMGNGTVAMMHTNLFRKATTALALDDATVRANLSAEAIACGNLSTTLAIHRRHFLKAVGYYGVTELMVPGRFGHVIAAWTRNDLPPEGIVYHLLHEELDREHGRAWFDDVMAPLVDGDRNCAIEITRGILFRLNSSRRYLDAMYAHLRSEVKLRRQPS